jgi:hypothetical protein
VQQAAEIVVRLATLDADGPDRRVFRRRRRFLGEPRVEGASSCLRNALIPKFSELTANIRNLTINLSANCI